MCAHRSLSTAGDKNVLLHRLKSFFGFEVEPLESETTSKACDEKGKSGWHFRYNKLVHVVPYFSSMDEMMKVQHFWSFYLRNVWALETCTRQNLCKPWSLESLQIRFIPQSLKSLKDIVLLSFHSKTRITQGPLKKWTEHCQELRFLKIHCREGWMVVDFLDHELL